MDLVLELGEDAFLSRLYWWFIAEEQWPRSHWTRQSVGLYIMSFIFANALYLLVSGLDYWCFFDRASLHTDKRYLKAQVKKEIMVSLKGFPLITLLFNPFFLLEVGLLLVSIHLCGRY